MGFTCSYCGQYHDELPANIEYEHPAEYYAVPAAERHERVQVHPDYHIIDNETFVIRGVLPMTVQGSEEEFGWGVWAIIKEESFRRYMELRDSPDADLEPPFPGLLSGGIGFYPESDLLMVAVYLQAGGQPPLFRVVSKEHPLYIDQQQGIPMEKVHMWLEEVERIIAKNREEDAALTRSKSRVSRIKRSKNDG